MNCRLPLTLIATLIAFAAPHAARAELPAPVRMMIAAAIATKDSGKVATVVEVAKVTNPDDLEEIEALHRAFVAERRELAALQAKEKELAIRNAGLLEQWSGRGEIGAFQSTGNSENVGITVGLSTGSIAFARTSITSAATAAPRASNTCWCMSRATM